LRAAFDQPATRTLETFLAAERQAHTVFPPADDVFRALECTPPAQVKAVILGQDPYPTPGHAHGLAFSVRPGVAPPRSLRNMFQELQADLGAAPPASGSLEPWARQGVLLLNTVLTVRAGEAGSHRGQGWERLTAAMLSAVAAGPEPVAFCLWGNDAQAKAALIDAQRHTIIASAHPSPLSARRGFFGSRPYSRINAALRAAGRTEIDWRLPANRGSVMTL